MENFNLKEIFQGAVHAIDTGDIVLLKQLLEQHHALAEARSDMPGEGYFKHPYLLWFVANNPVRIEKLPANIVAITALLVKSVKQYAPATMQHQLDYTLGLVETGRSPREAGVQIEMMDLLIDNGATPGDGQDALANGNIDAARHLVKRTGHITLTTAIGLNDEENFKKLLSSSGSEEIQVALMAASFYGRPGIIKQLLEQGADANGYIQQGFHTHASPLHQAVYSGSLESVELLVRSGADLSAIDKVYNGTPLGWAIHMKTEAQDENKKEEYKKIEGFLKGISNEAA